MTSSWIRITTSVTFAFVAFFMPHAAFAQNFLTDPIFPEECKCDRQINPADGTFIETAPDYGCVLQTLQNVVNAAVGFGIILCVMWIAYAGFSLMISGGNSEALSQAKTRLLNAGVGLIVILAAWLVVDFVLKVVYDPSVAFEGTAFGGWNAILAPTRESRCIQATTPTPLLSGSIEIDQRPSGPSTPGAPVDVGQVTTASGNCSPQNLAIDWNSEQKGKLFSCIINNESKCQNIPTGAVSSGSSAGGRYQVLMRTGPEGQGLNFSACVAVAKANGYTGSSLNCAQYFPGGNSDGSKMAAICRKAQLDPTCNTQAAQFLYNSSQGIGHWLGKGDIGGKNQACVTKYGR